MQAADISDCLAAVVAALVLLLPLLQLSLLRGASPVALVVVVALLGRGILRLKQ